jgi:hypothetical protein
MAFFAPCNGYNVLHLRVNPRKKQTLEGSKSAQESGYWPARESDLAGKSLCISTNVTTHCLCAQEFLQLLLQPNSRGWGHSNGMLQAI